VNKNKVFAIAVLFHTNTHTHINITSLSLLNFNQSKIEFQASGRSMLKKAEIKLYRVEKRNFSVFVITLLTDRQTRTHTMAFKILGGATTENLLFKNTLLTVSEHNVKKNTYIGSHYVVSKSPAIQEIAFSNYY